MNDDARGGRANGLEEEEEKDEKDEKKKKQQQQQREEEEEEEFLRLWKSDCPKSIARVGAREEDENERGDESENVRANGKLRR